MPINIPNLDDREYQDIVRDALARIPVHNPEWTNFNDSDPGVTLIQLFAFMTESILYRANQIPERNRLKFLQLLGITQAPAAAAQGFVTIRNERGPLELLNRQAPLSVRAKQVPFLTEPGGLSILPVTAQLFYKQAIEPDSQQAELYSQLYADLLGDGQPAFYETLPMPQPQADGTLPMLDLADAVDGCLWIALLARTAEERERCQSLIQGQRLTLGILPHREAEEGITLSAGQRTQAESISPITWEVADATTDAPRYDSLPFKTKGSVLHTPSLVELTLPETLTRWDFETMEPGLEGTQDYPPSLADTPLGEPDGRDRLLTWIRLRIDRSVLSADMSSVKAQLSWVGVNATRVRQEETVRGEVIGTGTGEPDQSFQLAHMPVVADTMVLTVDGQRWSQTDDLLAAPPEVSVRSLRQPLFQQKSARSEVTQQNQISGQAKEQQSKPIGRAPASKSQVFVLDEASGQITFGDGAHGMRPRSQSTIVASYRFGGGPQGNVGIDAINRSPQLPAGYKVTNPIRTWGGAHAQDVQSAEKSMAQQVQHRDRLVSVADFEAITPQTPGVDIGRVAVLPLFAPPDNLNRAGAITVMVIPQPAANQGLASENPQPDTLFLEAVCRHLQPRRLITTELHVSGPTYVDIWVSVGIETLGGYSAGPVQEAVKQALKEFLSPLTGGQQQTGWPLQVAVVRAELEAVVARVPGVRLVNTPLRMGSRQGALSVPARIELTGLQLPRLVGVSVVSGQARAIAQIQQPEAASPAGTAWTPIPVIPERC